MPLAPFWGIWADKYGRKMIIVRSAFGEALIFVVAALSTNVWHLLAARMLTGFILGNTGVMYAVISYVAPRRNWSLAIAMISVGGTLGMSLGPLLGGYLVTQLGIKTLFALDAGLSFASGLLLMGLLKEPRVPAQAGASTLKMLVSLGRSVAGMPVVLALFGAYAVVLIGTQISMPFVPILVDMVYQGVDLPAAIGMVSAGFAVASAICTPLWGRLGDRKGQRWALLLAVTLLIPALVGQAFAADVPQLLAMRVAHGAFQAAITPLVMALVATIAPEDRRASILNLSLFPNYLAWILGATAGAAIASISIQSLFTAGAAVTVVGLLLLMRFTPKDGLR